MICQKRPINTLNRPITVQKRPVYTQKRPINTQNRPITIQKRPVYTQKRRWRGTYPKSLLNLQCIHVQYVKRDLYMSKETQERDLYMSKEIQK